MTYGLIFWILYCWMTTLYFVWEISTNSLMVLKSLVVMLQILIASLLFAILFITVV
ncbi:hypothetical protein PR202_ga29566 [Eleusine coracana subsp. coracana]|uniref:Uncharacterized protein n=1 Tax=Eleusine coracana subsp. coracana TaxID=191504 RepID=A0AAV5DNA4_ELECO|nr:hypothetical protein PR202_ga29566 [Eleusine coracana subsp. coracana]